MVGAVASCTVKGPGTLARCYPVGCRPRREEGERREGEGRERERGRESERERVRGAPSYEPSVQGHTKREKKETMVFPATTQASKDTPVKKRRESDRERERGAPSYETSVQGHTKEERGAEKEESSH